MNDNFNMFKSIGHIKRIHKWFLFYSIYSFAGNSGSPLFWKSKYEDLTSCPWVIGIHKGKVINGNGILLNQASNEMINLCKILTANPSSDLNL